MSKYIQRVPKQPTGICQTIYESLKTDILSDLILMLKMVEIVGDSDSEISKQGFVLLSQYPGSFWKSYGISMKGA